MNLKSIRTALIATALTASSGLGSYADQAIQTESILSSYFSAWLETDSDKRREHLVACCEEADLLYLDPGSRVEGREALDHHIGGFQKSMPGARVEPTSGLSIHNGRVFFTWRLIGAAGETVIDGVDFVTLSEEGKIQEIVGFFGPPPNL